MSTVKIFVNKLTEKGMQTEYQPGCDHILFNNGGGMMKFLTKVFQLDLYVVGKLWIQALRAALVGTKFRMIPVVHAASPEEPKKPPPMKYTDLPLYCAPHYQYKDYIADKEKCPECNEKLLHKALIPYVREYRKIATEEYGKAYFSLRKNIRESVNTAESSKNDFKAYMRSPDNLLLRQGVLASGILGGYLIGRKGGIPKRIFCTSLGALATGALCFPKATDEYFREVCYRSAKFAVAVYNSTCGKDFSLRERVPCKEDMPPLPPPRIPLCCPPRNK